VVSFMREHALLGRLSDEELEDRIGRAYSAVTVGDLERLIADLPRAGHPAPRPRHAPRPRPERPERPRRAPRRRRDVHPVAVALGIVAFFAIGGPAIVLGGAALIIGLAVVLVAIALVLSFVFGPVILVGVLVAAAARRRRAASSMRWGPQY